MTPRRLGFVGRPLVAGLRIERTRLGEAAARARVLGLWSQGAVVRELGPDWLVTWPKPRRLPADAVPGEALEQREGALWAFPLGDAEDRPAGIGPGEVGRVVGGVVVAARPGARVDPASWLDLDAFPRRELKPLSAPAAAIVAAEARAPRPEDFRVPMPGAEAQALLDQLGRAATAPWWSRLAAWILPWLPTGRAAPSESPAGAPAPEPSGPGWFARAMAWLRLDLLVGAQAGRLVRKLIEELEGGDLEQALRRAIPLGGMGTGAGAGFALGMTLPFRDLLTVGSGLGGGGGSLSVHGELYGLLEQTYRNLAARLERAGDIEKAAYVLGELLGQPRDAVALCEKHERYELAAQIATVRRLEPALVVRLWVMAGDPQRALDVALATGAFGPALLQLEEKHPAQAKVVRLKWGLVLAQAGRHAAAVRLLEALSDPPPAFVREIADLGVAAGGPGAGELAVRRLSWGPDAAATEALRSLLADRDPRRSQERVAALQRLSEVDLDPTWSRTALRTLFAEEVATGARSELRSRLLARARDPVLKADLPSGSPPGPVLLTERSSALRLEIAGGGPGPEVTALAELSDGGVAVGYGQAGLRIVDARGHQRAHLEIPVGHLIPSTDRTRLLAREPDGPRVWQVDPFAGTAALWGSMALSCFEAVYDGVTWLVAEPDRVRLLDTTQDRPRSLWSTPLKGCSGLVRRDDRLFVLAEGELWNHQLGQGRDPILRSRSPVADGVTLGRGGTVASVGGPDGRTLIEANPAGTARSMMDLPGDVESAAHVEAAWDDWLVVGTEPDATPVGWDGIWLVSPGPPAKVLLRVVAREVISAREAGEHHLLLGTTDGQVVRIDRRTGQRRDLLVSNSGHSATGSPVVQRRGNDRRR